MASGMRSRVMQLQRVGKKRSSAAAAAAAAENPQWDDAVWPLKKTGTAADGVADDDSDSGTRRGRPGSRLAACDHQKHGEP